MPRGEQDQGKTDRTIVSRADGAAIRIIDANLNRAREALRVMEEYARLVLDDALVSCEIKETRHALAGAVIDLERRCEPTHGPLIVHRDIVGDVGCSVSTATERNRHDAQHVMTAAGKRLGEALRAIEEYGKTIDPVFAVAVERIRYRGYEIERRLVLTARAKERFDPVGLYVILTESLCGGDWFATAEAALRGGADCLQLRERDLADREVLGRAKRLAGLCREHGALFVVNDRADIALAAGADGVHVGQDDMSIADARRTLPGRFLVGVSTHTIDQVRKAAATVADYIAVGPMFQTPTKPQKRIAGTDTLRAARDHTSLPLVAIGGITADNAFEVVSAAPCILCVCRAVIAQPDVESVTRQLRKVIDQASQDDLPRRF